MDVPLYVSVWLYECVSVPILFYFFFVCVYVPCHPIHRVSVSSTPSKSTRPFVHPYAASLLPFAIAPALCRSCLANRRFMFHMHTFCCTVVVLDIYNFFVAAFLMLPCCCCCSAMKANETTTRMRTRRTI